MFAPDEIQSSGQASRFFKARVRQTDQSDEFRLTRFKEDGTVNRDESTLSVDLVRWTFKVNQENRVEIESHLLDLELDVEARGEDMLVVTWDEPEENLDELIQQLWAINGEPFEITHEEFHRVNLLVYHPEESSEVDRTVA
jgi:hypothetical protein